MQCVAAAHQPILQLKHIANTLRSHAANLQIAASCAGVSPKNWINQPTLRFQAARLIRVRTLRTSDPPKRGRTFADGSPVSSAKTVPRGGSIIRGFCLGFSFLLAAQEVLDVLPWVKNTRTQNPRR